ncbi:MAG TPA: hypothetical protein VF240_18335, partial [Pyrinomonadaceae bacterium]
MKLSRRTTVASALCYSALALAAAAGCNSTPEANRAATNAANAAATPSPTAQTLSATERPQKIKDQMAQRGEQDQASPVLKIAEPAEGATVSGATVRVRLNLSGDLKGYQPHKDPATQMGNHIHVILDNEPYEAYYELGRPFELRNVAAGKHTLRVFASRPWHESYKNDGSFQMVTFNVSGGGDTTQPTTASNGQRMADNRAPAANTNAAATPAASPSAEGKDFGAKPNAAGDVDHTKPLLTYSRPKGEYKDAEAEAIMIDFWLAHAKLEGDGGEYRVRYSVDGAPPQHLRKWEPIWLKGWTAGKHKVKVELVDRNDTVVQNGGYNSTEREITVTK